MGHLPPPHYHNFKISRYSLRPVAFIGVINDTQAENKKLFCREGAKFKYARCVSSEPGSRVSFYCSMGSKLQFKFKHTKIGIVGLLFLFTALG